VRDDAGRDPPPSGVSPEPANERDLRGIAATAGAIVGGSYWKVAGVAAGIAVGYWLVYWRRKRTSRVLVTAVVASIAAAALIAVTVFS
jgi:hypothetical protein